MSRKKPTIGLFRALFRYYKDPEASWLGKCVILLALVYVVVPVDLIPDVPIVGWLDDLGVMGLATAWLTRKVARYRVLPTVPGHSPALGAERADPEGHERLTRKPFSVSP